MLLEGLSCRESSLIRYLAFLALDSSVHYSSYWRSLVFRDHTGLHACFHLNKKTPT
jgi:hypothetical protein